MDVRTPLDSSVSIDQKHSEVETPALIVDVDVMERNMRDFVGFADKQGVTLRSHTKSHKIPGIAHKQIDLTGAGITCQTLSEVEVMAANGVSDIYLSYMVVEQSKLPHLLRLSENLEYFATTVDSISNVEPVRRAATRHNKTVNLVLEIDLGLNRVGTQPDGPVIKIAETIEESPVLSLDGIMGFEGHIGYGSDPARTVAEYERRCEEAMDVLAGVVDRIEDAGITVSDVMAGSTATAKYSAKHPVVTEIHPGMYPFNDAHLLNAVPDLEKDDCAMTVLTTVISKPTEDRAIVDAGSKTMSFDLDQPPLPANRDDIEYYNSSEEHGWINTEDAKAPVRVGDKIEFIIPHICTSLNLHDELIGVSEGFVADIWSIQGRGKLK